MQQTDVHTLKGGTGFKWGRPEPLVPRWRLHKRKRVLGNVWTHDQRSAL